MKDFHQYNKQFLQFVPVFLRIGWGGGLASVQQTVIAVCGSVSEVMVGDFHQYNKQLLLFMAMFLRLGWGTSIRTTVIAVCGNGSEVGMGDFLQYNSQLLQFVAVFLRLGWHGALSSVQQPVLAVCGNVSEVGMGLGDFHQYNKQILEFVALCMCSFDYFNLFFLVHCPVVILYNMELNGIHHSVVKQTSAMLALSLSNLTA